MREGHRPSANSGTVAWQSALAQKIDPHGTNEAGALASHVWFETATYSRQCGCVKAMAQVGHAYHALLKVREVLVTDRHAEKTLSDLFPSSR